MSRERPVRATGPPGRRLLPPEAEAEILARLFVQMHISSEEIVEILRRHDVSGDIDALQDGYRKRLGQRLLASLRDENGDREVLSTNGGDYVVVECCNDRQQLQAIRHRIQGQMNGLDMSAAKVQGRIRVLERFIARFRKKE